MPNLLRIVSLFFIFLVIGIRPAASDTYPFLLWYPGAEGTAEQAAPILETWTDYLAEKGLPATLKPIYQNSPFPEGIQEIKKIKPAVAIVSLDVFLNLSKDHPLTLLAQTRKQPAGDGSFQYSIVQNKTAKETKNLYLSEPLTENFARNIVLRNSPHYRNLPLEYAKQALRALKKIASGELSGAILLNDYQVAVLGKMKAEWTTQLKQITDTPSLPAPPIILFEEWKKDFPHEKFISLLTEMEKDPEGIEILEELRMKGFMPPNKENYESLKASFDAP